VTEVTFACTEVRTPRSRTTLRGIWFEGGHPGCPALLRLLDIGKTYSVKPT
jgi:hypothetical protein